MFGIDDESVRIMIQETNETAEAGVPGMKCVFRDCLKAFGDTRPDEEIDVYFDSMFNEKKFTDEINGIKFEVHPDAELSYGHSRTYPCHWNGIITK